MLKPEQLIRAFAVYCSACYYLMVNYLFRNLHKINIQKKVETDVYIRPCKAMLKIKASSAGLRHEKSN